jgi:Flp pilus assembly protein TadG
MMPFMFRRAFRSKIHVKQLDRRGATSVEFALCLPIVVLVFFGIIDFCRFFFCQYANDQAAYEACRIAIVPGAQIAAVQTRATTYLNNCGISGATVTVEPRDNANVVQTAINRQTKSVAVTVSFPFSNAAWVTPQFFVNRTVTSTCTLNHEYTFMY